MGRSSPRLFYSGFVGCCGDGRHDGFFFMLAWIAGWKFYWLWFVAANIVAFVLYRYDKAQAQREGLRVPEVSAACAGHCQRHCGARRDVQAPAQARRS